MRASFLFGFGLAIAVANCGGNVVVDGPPRSTGGTGGTVVTGGTGGNTITGGTGGGVVESSSASGGAVSCPNQACETGSDGCQCEGPCTDGHSRSVTCKAIPPETTCVCALDEVMIGKCTTPPDAPLSCDVFASCCGAVFFGAPGG